TERKAAEQQLTATKDYLENIIEGSLDAIVVHDSTQHITQCNRYFLELLGYTEDEVLGNYLYEFAPNVGETYESTMGDTIRINDDFYNDSVAMIGILIETGKAANWQTYYLCKNGKVVPVEQNSFMLKDKQGNISGSASIIRDITERQRIETERERLIAELQKALVQVKTLSGFIPICSSCKKVRNDSGYWEQVEGYISTHSEAEFSHSICPDCAQKLYPEIYAKIGKDKK
ncbi:MAG: PAS domain S-box protein, partial [Proteobacteria bacterium]|nr:PAS domain S-box protein [Pseudomonadota bacterium]